MMTACFFLVRGRPMDGRMNERKRSVHVQSEWLLYEELQL